MNPSNTYTNFRDDETKFDQSRTKKFSDMNGSQSISAFQVIGKNEIVDSIMQEIDCHCHSYQFWFVVFLVLYVINFVTAIFTIGSFYTGEEVPSAQWLYITYAIMAILIAIVYILMEIETWTIHNCVLYFYSGVIGFLNFKMLAKLIEAEKPEETSKRITLGLLSIITSLITFWIVPKLRYRARNLINLEQKRRRVRAEYGL